MLAGTKLTVMPNQPLEEKGNLAQPGQTGSPRACASGTRPPTRRCIPGVRYGRRGARVGRSLVVLAVVRRFSNMDTPEMRAGPPTWESTCPRAGGRGAPASASASASETLTAWRVRRRRGSSWTWSEAQREHDSVNCKISQTHPRSGDLPRAPTRDRELLPLSLPLSSCPNGSALAFTCSPAVPQQMAEDRP